MDKEIEKQDEKLELLSHGVRGLKTMATTIGNEIDHSNIMIENVAEDVDFTNHRIKKSTHRIQKLTDESGNNKMCCLILILIIVIVLLTIVYFT